MNKDFKEVKAIIIIIIPIFYIISIQVIIPKKDIKNILEESLYINT